ncbi:hypothetical protein RB195_025943 [Necator americanus]|uniref:VHS domain protein n=1 Tax=Necator americanus TaxID=51031 RepID=A0ABR1EUK0_NECAM
MVDHNAGEKPIEYWISRSTDPFIDEETRKQNVQKLCDRVNYEADGAMVATGILAHKIVSPDQDEALYSLQAVDQLVRKCGEKVHNRVGKFRFLNQLVKLITPKYLGAQTSPEVKELAIKLLYSWQKSMRHVEKFKEVYDSLREHHLITADPIIPEEEIMIVQSNPPKLAVFEDEEKARLLKELLKSTNPDDLQAANRLIQTLVKSEDQKIERRHKRADELEQVRQLCKRLEDAMMEKTAEELGITPDIIYTEAKMKTLADELMAVRPHLFRFASDATENDEEALAEILAVNDQVNQLIQKYRNFSQTGRVRQHNGGSSEEAADLLGPEPNDSVTGPTSSTVPLDFNADALLKQKFSKEVPSSSSEFADVPFIGFDRSMTPALPRKVKPPSQPATSVLDDLTTLIDGDLFSKQPPSQTFKNIKPTLNDLCTSSSVSNVSISPLDNLNRSTFEADLLSILPERISFDPNTVQLANVPPRTVLSKQNIHILLYSCVPQLRQSTRSFIVAIINTNVDTLRRFRLMMGTANKKASVRLEDKGSLELSGVTPKAPVPTAYLMLCVLPLDDIHEVDLDFSLTYTQQFERSITGNIVLPL